MYIVQNNSCLHCWKWNLGKKSSKKVRPHLFKRRKGRCIFWINLTPVDNAIKYSLNLIHWKVIYLVDIAVQISKTTGPAFLTLTCIL